MKRLDQQNYYDLLDISPQASFGDVRSAYEQAVTIYAPDSLSTYSLFTPEERELILSRLAKAYKTLTNSQLRKEYNRVLIEQGELSSRDAGFFSEDDSTIAKGKIMEVSTEHLTQTQKETQDQNVSFKKNLDLFENQNPVSGKIIKKVRTSQDMSLGEVFKKTSIPRETLEDIEEERFKRLPALVYLKGFLKAYANVLHVDQTAMVDGYVKRYLEWKNTYRK